ncbi:zinc-ribbon domain-containing protein [Ahrensia marina]|uniref:zinc-ribbon domain-containing protein n=1 Tax=Ahrensia marina TaxID=1514904 RepID=UPI0035CED1B4
MKIVCPHCSSDYDVADDMLGPNGRKVKCASCQKIWHAVPEEEIASTADIDALFEAGDVQNEEAMAGGGDAMDGFAAVAEDGVGEGDGDFASWDESQVATDATQDALASGPVDAGVEAPVPRKHRRVRLKGQRSGPSKFEQILRRAATVAAPAGVALGLIGLVLAIPARDAVVRAVPDLARLYQMVGLDVNVRGIEFSPFTAERALVAGLTVLRIEGSMVNADDSTRAVAPLRMALLAETGAELFVWRVDPAATELLPEQSVPVFSELTAPPETVASVSVRFLQEDERLPGAIN